MCSGERSVRRGAAASTQGGAASEGWALTVFFGHRHTSTIGKQTPAPRKQLLELEVEECESAVADDDIRKSYKRLALLWHPDKNYSPELTERFKRISLQHAHAVEGRRWGT